MRIIYSIIPPQCFHNIISVTINDRRTPARRTSVNFLEMQCNASDTLPESLKWEAVGNFPQFWVGKNSHCLIPSGAPHAFLTPVPPFDMRVCYASNFSRSVPSYPVIIKNNRVNCGVMLVLSIPRFSRVRISDPAGEGSIYEGDMKRT